MSTDMCATHVLNNRVTGGDQYAKLGAEDDRVHDARVRRLKRHSSPVGSQGRRIVVEATLTEPAVRDVVLMAIISKESVDKETVEPAPFDCDVVAVHARKTGRMPSPIE